MEFYECVKKLWELEEELKQVFENAAIRALALKVFCPEPKPTIVEVYYGKEAEEERV